MRWENRISCELRRGHAGVHTNQGVGLQWWGQVLFDPVRGSLADTQSDNLDDPEVRPIRPDWADETEALLLATWGDHAPQRLPRVSVSPQAIPVPTSVVRPVNRLNPAYRPVQRPNGRGRIVAPHPGALFAVVAGSGTLLGVLVGGLFGVLTFASSLVMFGLLALVLY